MATALAPEIISLRRELHRFPELSFQEKETSARIKQFLRENDIPFSEGWAEHGIVAVIEGGSPGHERMLRADMDALPIREANQTEYASQHEGIMHACGHDVHMASMLGTSKILKKLQPHISGTIKFIFQPGEEKLPGGASVLLSEGLFTKHHPEWIAGQHVYPSLPAGHVGFREGLYMASADELYITIHGKGGHAATPHMCVDPIVIAAEVITGLQTIISRRRNPIHPAVLTIGKMWSDGGATNIIPERVFLEGTLRAMDEKWRSDIHHTITAFIEQTCNASGATAGIRIEKGYPCLINDPRTTANARRSAEEYLGTAYVHTLDIRMASEDFAFYSQEIPATFYRLGTGHTNRENLPVHHPRFDIDEDALRTGMGLMAYIAMTN